MEILRKGEHVLISCCGRWRCVCEACLPCRAQARAQQRRAVVNRNKLGYGGGWRRRDMRTAVTMLDERESKLPVWVREKLAGLRQEVESSVRHADFVEEENTRLRAVIEGRFTGEPEDDTFLVNDDTGKELPLGKGPDVRFADFYTVRYGNASSTGPTKKLIDGARALIVETDKPMQITPTLSPDIIIITAAP